MGQVVPFMQANVVVPAHIQKFLNDNANIDPKDTVPQLSFRGKVWRIVLNGEENVVQREGEPVSIVRVIVLDHNKARSRSYYEGAYEEGKAQMPACWSSDGVAPDASVKEPQSKSCASCPMAAKGSKITPNGKEVTACSTYKRVAVIPSNDLKFPPLLLRIPQTSMWDKNNEENEAKGWFAWDQYIDMLRKRGVAHTAVVITKIKFDARTAYPKLLFAAHDFVTGEDMPEVMKLLGTEPVAALLKAPEIDVAKRTDKDADSNDEDKPAAAAPTKPTKAAKADDDEDDGEVAPPAKAAKPAKAAPADDDDGDYDDDPRPTKAAKAAPAPAEDDDEEEAPPPKRNAKADKAEKPKKAAKAAPPPADDDDEDADEPKPKAAKANGNGKSSGLGDLMDEWDV